MSNLYDNYDYSYDNNSNLNDESELIQTNIEEENYESVKPISTNSHTKQTSSRKSNEKSKKKTNKSKKKKSISSNTSNRASLGTSNLSVQSTKTKKKKNQNASKTQDKNLEKDLKHLMKDFFSYEFCNDDLEFLKELYVKLPILYEIWDRIGFNTETKDARLDNFYKSLTENVIEIIDNEEDLEAKIEKSIESHHKKIKEICFRLKIKYEELKSIRSCPELTMLEEEELLRNELKRLEKEVKKRFEEFDQFAKLESTLCDRLKLKKTELNGEIPSECDLKNIKKRIEELEQILKTRKQEMSSLQEEINKLNEDLDMSRADSFIEAILFESVDNVCLGADDIQKANELRNELKTKHNILVNEITSLRVKIKELWTKLSIENLNIKEMINAPIDSTSSIGVSKRTLVNELNKEYERCVKIKMENMQKFIEAIRVELREYCSKLFMGDKEIKKLNQELLGLTDFTEDLLTQHEQKLEDFKFMYEESSSLYEKTSKWINLWSEFVQFEEKTKDPLRFKQRGYNMLVEEKQRKVFNNQLPKLEEELKHLAEEYKQTNNGQEFTIYGQSYADFILTTKLDYEESKQKEKYEKQVLKDNIKKNESRFGSKPITPLAIKNKRKLTGNVQESQLNTPGRKSKLQKTDLMSTLNSPGMSRLGSTILGKSKAGSIAKTKLSISKRKSRTPGKNRILRRSKQLALNKNESKAVNAEDNDTTLKTTFSSTIQSTMSSNSSNLYSGTQSKLSSKTSSSSVTGSKYPPLSSSSKFVQQTSTTTLQRMTSTASNTFIEEEEHNENIHHGQVVVEAAAKITEMVALKTSTQSKMYNCDVNYLEFSRDLPKPIKFGYDSTNSTQQLPRSSSTQSRLGIRK